MASRNNDTRDSAFWETIEELRRLFQKMLSDLKDFQKQERDVPVEAMDRLLGKFEAGKSALDKLLDEHDKLHQRGKYYETSKKRSRSDSAEDDNSPIERRKFTFRPQIDASTPGDEKLGEEEVNTDAALGGSGLQDSSKSG